MKQYLKILICSVVIALSTLAGYGQNAGSRVLTGIVRDPDGVPVIGAGVTCPDNKQVVVTDLDGRYSINVPSGKEVTVIFSCVGMNTLTVKVSPDRNTLDPRMAIDNKLEEAVIIGAYGSVQRREDLVGSAFQVNSEQLKNKPAARIDNLLEGLVPGMVIEPNTDDAATTRTRLNTRIRGEGSLSGSSEPLWVIDGVPQYTGSSTNTMPGMSYTVPPMSYLNVEDIESITVLKDADQVSIYGANGANGVILVTTKKGSKDTPLKVNATLRYGLNTIDKSTMFKTMNAAQYLEVAQEAWVNAGNKASDFPYQDNYYNSYSTTDTDWKDVYLGLGSTTDAMVSITSGTDKMTNRVSGSYYDNRNIVQTDRQQRFTLSFRSILNLTDKLEAGISMDGSYNSNKLFPVSSSAYLETQPIFSPYLEDGYSFRLYNNEWDQTQKDFVMKQFYYNYVPDREYNDDTQRTVVTSARFNLDWKILKGLKLSTNFGFKYNSGHEDIYYSMYTRRGMSDGVPVGSAAKNDVSYSTWYNSTLLNYDGSFGKFKLSSYAGLELNNQQNQYSYVSGSHFSNDRIREVEYAGVVSSYCSSNIKHTRDMSYFARATLSYDSRYYLAANLRRNGNSIFGEYSKWGTFWSIGGSWNVHKEDFYDVGWLNLLKLKASYGKAGSSKIDATTATGTYTYSDSYSYRGIPGAVLGSVPNPGLSWEFTWESNYSVRGELSCGLDVEIEAYNYVTRDLLSKVYVSRTISEDRQYANVGSVRNTGVELTLNGDIIDNRTWNWHVSFNAAHNRNVILELYNGVPTSFGETVWMEGYSTDTHMLIRWAGVDPLDGEPMWYDKEGNITKVYDYDNRVPGKTSNPFVSGGLVNTVGWKNFTLSVQMNYMLGGYSNATYARRMMEDGYDIISTNQAVEVYYKRWKKPGDLTSFPKVSNASRHTTSYNDRFLISKTYCNLSNIALGWQVPSSFTDRLNLRGATLNFICDNAFLFTPGMSRKFNSYKTMKSGYPVTRTYTFSLALSL